MPEKKRKIRSKEEIKADNEQKKYRRIQRQRKKDEKVAAAQELLQKLTAMLQIEQNSTKREKLELRMAKLKENISNIKAPRKKYSNPSRKSKLEADKESKRQVTSDKKAKYKSRKQAEKESKRQVTSDKKAKDKSRKQAEKESKRQVTSDKKAKDKSRKQAEKESKRQGKILEKALQQESKHYATLVKKEAEKQERYRIKAEKEEIREAQRQIDSESKHYATLVKKEAEKQEIYRIKAEKEEIREAQNTIDDSKKASKRLSAKARKNKESADAKIRRKLDRDKRKKDIPIYNWSYMCDKKPSESLPFTSEVIQSAYESFNPKTQKNHCQELMYNKKFVQYLFLKFGNKMEWIVVNPTMADPLFPTFTIPWSTSQLIKASKNARLDIPDTRASIVAHMGSVELQKALMDMKPESKVFEMSDYRDSYNINTIVNSESPSVFLPITDNMVAHWLWVFDIKSNIHPFNVTDYSKLTNQQRISMRMALLKAMEHSQLLDTYVRNSHHPSVRKLAYKKMGSFENLLFAYSNYTQCKGEINAEQLSTMWSTDVIRKSFQFIANNGFQGVRVSTFLKDIEDKPTDYELISLNYGTVIVSKEIFDLLRNSGVVPKKFRRPRWVPKCVSLTKTSIKNTVSAILSTNIESGTSETNDKNQTSLNKKVNRALQASINVTDFVEYYFNRLLRTDIDFKFSIALTITSIGSLRESLLKIATRGKKEEKKAQAVETVRKLTDFKFLEELRKGNLFSSVLDKKRQKKFKDDIYKLAEQGLHLIQTSEYPIVNTYAGYQEIMKKNNASMVLDAVVPNPEDSACGQLAPLGISQFKFDNSWVKASFKKKYFIDPNKSQQFTADVFQPGNEENGKIWIHSVGCLAPNTPVLLWNGSVKRADEVSVGDELIGDNGTPRIVLELIRGTSEMYRVEQNNGESYVVNDEHILSLKLSENYNYVIDIKMKDYLQLPEDKKSKLKGYKKMFPMKRDNKTVLTSINVIHVGQGDYFGWNLDGNKRFLLGDSTVTHNSGKTCLTKLVASEFALAGFDIIFATKSSLKNDAFKNDVVQICNVMIRAMFQRIYWTKGEKSAEKFMQSIPPITDVKAVMRFMKDSIGMTWYNFSYRQLTNAIDSKNWQGSLYKKNATYSTNAKQQIDPLRKKLIILDEAHKIFTGEIKDANERPDLNVLRDALKHSYITSGNDRCRVIFMTATPMIKSIMPLLSMINLLSVDEPFEMMKVPDSRLTGSARKEGQRLADEENKKIEVKVANQFLGKNDNKPTTIFNTNSVRGVTKMTRRELNNQINHFWNYSRGIISYLNLSSDYSRFPHTIFAPKIVPSASHLQERLIGSQIAASTRSVPLTIKSIRSISAWAFNKSYKDGPTKPTSMDKAIISTNKTEHFFESSMDELENRFKMYEETIIELENGSPDPEAVMFMDKANEKLQNVIEERDSMFTEMERMNRLPEEDKDKQRLIKNLKKRISNITYKVNEADQEFKVHSIPVREFNIKRTENIIAIKERMTSLNLKIKKMKKRLDKSDKRKGEQSRNFSAIAKAFMNEPEQEDDKLIDSISDGVKNDVAEDEDKNYEDEEVDDNDTTVPSFIRDMKSGEVYSEKIYYEEGSKVKNIKPKNPRGNWFDLPKYFNKETVKADLPLFSPKALKLMDQIKMDAKSGKDKSLVFCTDISEIRAVGAALVTEGYKFGMKLGNTRWKKNWYYSDTGEIVKSKGKPLEVLSKTSKLTWVLDDSNPKYDYKRFVVLTKSKMGGPGGASINDFTINQIKGRGDNALYNKKENADGKSFSIVIIDENYKEGVDLLDTTYGHLFSEDLANADIVQIVGRISRFCGMTNKKFKNGYGWPQVIYRYGLKFATGGVRLTSTQTSNLNEHATTKYSNIFPDMEQSNQQDKSDIMEQFFSKVNDDTFGPSDLTILLRENTKTQSIRKKSLDVFSALMERVSYARDVFKPAHKNMEKAKADFQQQLEEEAMTENDYKESLAEMIKPQNKTFRMTLRKRKRMKMLDIGNNNTRIVPFVDSYVDAGVKKHPLKAWWDDEKHMTLLIRNIKQEALSEKHGATFIDVSDEMFSRITRAIVDDKLKIYEPKEMQRQQRKSEIVKLKRIKAEKRAQRDKKAIVKKAKKNSGMNIRSIKSEAELSNSIGEVMEEVRQTYPDFTFEDAMAYIYKGKTPSFRNLKPKRKTTKKKTNGKKKPTKSRRTIPEQIKEIKRAKKGDKKFNMRLVKKNEEIQNLLLEKAANESKFSAEELKPFLIQMMQK
jgi:hypothetical protein